MKTKFIKYLSASIAIALAAAFYVPLSAEEQNESPSRKTILEINQVRGDSDVERSLNPLLEVYYDNEVEILELFYSGLDHAEAYIVDSCGYILSFCLLESGQNVIIDAPTAKGIYYIVIISDFIYGEGKFIVE